MYGIHKMSVAKVVLSWSIVVAMIVHAICLWRGRGEGRRRWNGGALEEEDVVIGIEKEEIEMGKKVGYEGRGVRFV